VEATNAVMARLANLLEHQKRFVRDASHQLRTPLAVLKTQVQSARAATWIPNRPGRNRHHGAARHRTGQPDAGAGQGGTAAPARRAPPCDWDQLVRAVALDVSALIAEARLDFDIETLPRHVQAHEWALRELTRNLLHNAIKHTPPGGAWPCAWWPTAAWPR
jgi:two-component system sensor histidine kinase TctE